MAALRGESMRELQTLLPRLPPRMYWPALARWDGPLAARQRHVTLEGQCAVIPLPYCSGVHILQRNLWPLILHPTPHNCFFSFLLEHKGGMCTSLGGRCCIFDLPSLDIGFGDIRTHGFGCAPRPPPPPQPNCRASDNANHVESFQHQNADIHLPILQILLCGGTNSQLWRCRHPFNSHWQERKEAVAVTKGIRLTFYSKWIFCLFYMKSNKNNEQQGQEKSSWIPVYCFFGWVSFFLVVASDVGSKYSPKRCMDSERI